MGLGTLGIGRISGRWSWEVKLKKNCVCFFKTIYSFSFNITYSSKTVLRQLAVAERKLKHMDARLRQGVQAHIEKLKEDVVTTKWRGVQMGSDYVVGCKMK
jgi:hypothetical protein